MRAAITEKFYPPTGQIEPCYLLLRREFPEFSAPWRGDERMVAIGRDRSCATG